MLASIMLATVLTVSSSGVLPSSETITFTVDRSYPYTLLYLLVSSEKINDTIQDPQRTLLHTHNHFDENNIFEYTEQIFITKGTLKFTSITTEVVCKDTVTVSGKKLIVKSELAEVNEKLDFLTSMTVEKIDHEQCRITLHATVWLKETKLKKRMIDFGCRVGLLRTKGKIQQALNLIPQ